MNRFAKSRIAYILFIAAVTIISVASVADIASSKDAATGATKRLDLKGVEHGILVLTFDDREFNSWIKAIPLFAKYNAHASFFVMGKIDEEAVVSMRKLLDAGHTVGIHTLNHCNIAIGLKKYSSMEVYFQKEIETQLKQCEAAGIRISTMAYPNNLHTPESDRFLSAYFERFRVDCDGKTHNIGIALDEIPRLAAIGGVGLGRHYKTDPAVVEKSIREAAAKNEMIAFFSHDIQEKNTNDISITLDFLEMILRTASECGMKIVSMEELPRTQ